MTSHASWTDLFRKAKKPVCYLSAVTFCSIFLVAQFISYSRKVDQENLFVHKMASMYDKDSDCLVNFGIHPGHKHYLGACRPVVPSLEECLYYKKVDRAKRLRLIAAETKTKWLKSDVCSVRKDYFDDIPRMKCETCESYDMFYYDFINEHRHEVFREKSDLENAVGSVLSLNLCLIYITCSTRSSRKRFQVLYCDIRRTRRRISGLNVIYFETLSRFNFQRTFRNTGKLLAKLRKNGQPDIGGGDVGIYDFQLVQCTSARITESISTLLDGQPYSTGHLNRSQILLGKTNINFAPVINRYHSSDIYKGYAANGTYGAAPEHLVTMFERICSPVAEGDYEICMEQHRPFLTKSLMLAVENIHVKNKRPMFTMAILQNFDDTAAMDRVIGEHLQNMMYFANIPTILMSGHGDVGSESMYKTAYGHVSVANPLFVLLLSKSFERKANITSEIVRENQYRLISGENFHRTLQDLAAVIEDKTVIDLSADSARRQPPGNDQTSLRSPSSIFQRIDRARTCNNLPIPHQVMCVCAGSESTAKNDSLQVAYAEFAVGEMNRIIQKNVAAAQNYSTGDFDNGPFGRCQKLRGLRFDNVTITHRRHQLVVKMTIYVVPLAKSMNNNTSDKHTSHRYYVTLTQEFGYYFNGENLLVNNALKLVSYYRSRENGGGDDGDDTCNQLRMDSHLCLCNPTQLSVKGRGHNLITLIPHRHFGRPAQVINLHRRCLLLGIRRFNQTVTYEASNLCRGHVYQLKLTLLMKNMVALAPLPINVKITPMKHCFLVTVRKTSYVPAETKLIHRPYFTYVSVADDSL